MIVKSKLFFDSIKSLCCIIGVYGLIIVPAMSASLPSGYTELEYLQSSGSQYINTGVAWSDINKIVFNVKTKTSTNNNVIISGASNTILVGTPWIGYSSSSTMGSYESGITLSPAPTITELMANFNEVTATVSTSSTSLIEFGSYNSSTYQGNNLYKNFQIYQDNILVRHFIPAKRKSDGTIGMYDIANSGKNLFDVNNYTRTSSMLYVPAMESTGTQYDNIKSDSNSPYLIYIPVKKNTTYTLMNFNTTTDRLRACFTVNIPTLGETAINRTGHSIWDGKAITLTNDSAGNYLVIQPCSGAKLSQYDEIVAQLVVIEGSVAPSDYEPYPFYTNSGTGTFIAGPEVGIKVATTKYVETAFADSVSELNATMGTIKDVVDNTIIQADRIGKLATGKQNRPAENCPDGAQCLLITEADGSLHWYPICNADGTVGTQSSN